VGQAEVASKPNPHGPLQLLSTSVLLFFFSLPLGLLLLLHLLLWQLLLWLFLL
jgi:hypothetical protein